MVIAFITSLNNLRKKEESIFGNGTIATIFSYFEALLLNITESSAFVGCSLLMPYILKRMSIRHSGEVYSFQCGIQLLIFGGKWSYCLWVGWVNVVVSLVLELLFLSWSMKILSRISMRYCGDAYSFQCGMQLLIFRGKWSHYLWVGWVNVVVSLVLELLFLSQSLKILNRMSMRYLGMLTSSRLECSC